MGALTSVNASTTVHGVNECTVNITLNRKPCNMSCTILYMKPWFVWKIFIWLLKFNLTTQLNHTYLGKSYSEKMVEHTTVNLLKASLYGLEWICCLGPTITSDRSVTM